MLTGTLNQEVKFLIAQEKVMPASPGVSEEKTEVRYMYYNTSEKYYSATTDTMYSTKYATQEDATKRKNVLQMLADMEESDIKITYHVIKSTNITEVVETV